MAASTQCFLHQYHALRSSPARTSSVSSPKPNQLVCRAQKQDDTNNNAVSRRLALTVLIGTVAIGSKVSPADAAYGEAGTSSALSYSYTSSKNFYTIRSEYITIIMINSLKVFYIYVKSFSAHSL